jgi:serine phosphatase RsbU (regulator of sigma subunit)/HAMP domain-containing protein
MFNNFKVSLKFKIALVFTMLVIVMMGAVTYIFTIRELDLRVEQVKLRMERLAQNIATIRSVETEDWDVYQTYINNQLTLNADIVYIVIFDEKNELKVHSLNREWIDLDSPQTLSREEQTNIILQLDQRQIADESQRDLESKSVNIIIGEKNLGIVKVGFSLVELNDEKRANLLRNFELAGVFLFLVIIASILISHRIVTPLNKLTRSMEQISKGDLNQELYIKSRDEIGEMAKTFNFMTKGLQEKEQIESFSRELGFTLEFKKITQLITERISKALKAKSSYLFLREKGEQTEFNAICAYPQSYKKDISFIRDQSLCELFLSARSPIALSKTSMDAPLYIGIRKLSNQIDNIIITPIIINDEVIGILVLEVKDKSTTILETEQQFLTTLIGQAGLAIENALLLNELTEQERLKRELEIARMVQNSLLPQSNPTIPGLDIDGVCLPATEIGGDYFDYFQLDENTMGVVIADVTGKGTSAAFYMAVVKGIMLSLTPIYSSPKQLLCELNRSLFGTMDRKIFITMIYGIFDLTQKKLVFARAGHNALIVKKNNNSEVKCLTPPGIGLGLEEGKIFDKNISEQVLNFGPGDSFLFYTDGITEAMNMNKDEFGEKKLLNIFSSASPKSSVKLREQIINEINNFVQESSQHDDITLVTVTAT